MPKASQKPRPSKLSELLAFDAPLLVELPPDGLLVGMDEVGRGSLIGSVVGGAVCLPRTLDAEQKRLLAWLDDSKKLTAAVRADLSEALHAFCLTGLGVAEKHEVESLNVHYASLLAVYRALQQLAERASLCLASQSERYFLIMDGKAVIPDLPSARQRAFVKGDGRSAAIAAASVIAKHHRDGWVKAQALQYPGYDWESNMGYPAPKHLAGLRALGLTPLHRRHFKKVHEQLTLWESPA